ncbi:MAG: hypothetical protein ACJ789_18420 [Thermomicrobiales bacterium]
MYLRDPWIVENETRIYLKLLWLLIILGSFGLGVTCALPDAKAQRNTPTAHPLLGAWGVVEDGSLTVGAGLLAFTADGVVTVTSQSGRTGLGSWAATGPHATSGARIIPGKIEPGIMRSAELRVNIAVNPTGAGFTADYELTERTVAGSVDDTSQRGVFGTGIEADGASVCAAPASCV